MSPEPKARAAGVSPEEYAYDYLLGDGGAHYGAICDASYPTFMLTY